MKFPSLQRLIADLAKVMTHFPFETFFAFTGTCAATALIELQQNNMEYSSWCLRMLMVSNLGLLLSFSTTLYTSSRDLSFKNKIPFYLAAILITITFFFILDPMHQESDIIRFVLVSFGFHLLVSFAAFIKTKNSISAFWQFNKVLFLRFLEGVLYSGVLYIGLCAAVGSMNFLFNFNFEWDTFAIIGVWIAILFQTLFFLSGVPATTESHNEELSYPKGLKLFTQYVLIPLASVYVAILLAYEIKILLQWNMPKGLVSSLILGYAVFGILSFLLVYPLRNLEGHTWIKTYSKSFFFLLLPLLVLLYLAIVARVGKYGITEERYFLISLAIWLSFITAYFIISAKQNIMVIPVSLCLVTLLAVYGPLSAFNIAEQSQLSQLKEVLQKNKVLLNGKLQPITKSLDSTDTERIRDVSRHLISHYGLESLQPLIKENLSKVQDSIKNHLNKNRKGRADYTQWDLDEKQQNWIYAHYKLPVNYAQKTFGEFYTAKAQDEEIIPLHSADYLIELNSYRKAGEKIKLEKNKHLAYTFNDTSFQLRINKDSVEVDLLPLIQRIKINSVKKAPSPDTGQGVTLPRNILTEQFDLNSYHVTLLFNSIQISGKALKIDTEEAVLLLQKQ